MPRQDTARPITPRSTRSRSRDSAHNTERQRLADLNRLGNIEEDMDQGAPKEEKSASSPSDEAKALENVLCNDSLTQPQPTEGLVSEPAFVPVTVTSEVHVEAGTS